MITYNGNAHYLAMRLAESQGLTDDQKAMLTAELAKGKYQGKSAVECLVLLHDPTTDSVAQYRMATGQELKAWLAPIGRSIAYGNFSPQVKATWVDQIKTINSIYEDSYQFDPNDPVAYPTFATIATQAVAAGVVDQATIDEFKARYVSVYAVSPVEKLFGQEVFIEVADVEGFL